MGAGFGSPSGSAMPGRGQRASNAATTIVGGHRPSTTTTSIAAAEANTHISKYILNSNFEGRQAAARRTLERRLSFAQPALYMPTSQLHSGETQTKSPEMKRFLDNMMLQLEKLSSENLAACFLFMREWNYTDVISETQLTAAHPPAHLLLSYDMALDLATDCYVDGASANVELLEAEMVAVRTAGHARADELEFSGDSVIGMSILHEFVLDILGRDTPYGKIFVRKAHTDFRKMHVVSGVTKVLAGSIIALVNLFCLFYAVLKGYSKGVSWQQQFLFASILQLVFELFLFETLLVLWNNVVVPQLAADQVNDAYNKILNTINKFAEDIQFKIKFSVGARGRVAEGVADNVDVLNVADYFFIATHLARAFPENIESQIVRRYESTHPTQSLKKKLRPLDEAEDEREAALEAAAAAGDTSPVARWALVWLKYFATSLLVFTVTWSASLPTVVQDLILSVVQPCLLGALTYFIFMCFQQPLLYLGLVACVLLIGYVLYRQVLQISDRQHKRLPSVERAEFPQLDQIEEASSSSDSSADSDGDNSSGFTMPSIHSDDWFMQGPAYRLDSSSSSSSSSSGSSSSESDDSKSSEIGTVTPNPSGPTRN